MQMSKDDLKKRMHDAMLGMSAEQCDLLKRIINKAIQRKREPEKPKFNDVDFAKMRSERICMDYASIKKWKVSEMQKEEEYLRCFWEVIAQHGRDFYLSKEGQSLGAILIEKKRREKVLSRKLLLLKITNLMREKFIGSIFLSIPSALLLYFVPVLWVQVAAWSVLAVLWIVFAKALPSSVKSKTLVSDRGIEYKRMKEK